MDKGDLAIGGAAIAILAALMASVASESPPVPPDCKLPSDTPCLTSPGIVRWIDSRDDAYQFDTLEEWQQGWIDAADPSDIDSGGPGPNAP